MISRRKAWKIQDVRTLAVWRLRREEKKAKN